MKVALISSCMHACPPMGYGSEMTTYYLARGLKARGHEVTLFAGQGSRNIDGIPTYEMPDPEQEDGLLDLIGAEGSPYRDHREVLISCDLVHDMSLTARVSELVCEKHPCPRKTRGILLGGKQLPHVTTLNGISFWHPRPPADHNIVVVSEAAKRHALTGEGAWENTPFEQYQVEDVPGKLAHEPFVVRYGTDTEYYKPAGEPSDYVLYVGRPHPAKGIDWFLRVAKQMPYRQFVMAWHADTKDQQDFELFYLQLVRDWGVKNVEFIDLGTGPDHHEMKRSLLVGAHALLHPAVYADACPSTVLEALACGTPVVGTDKGGVPELVKHEETGFITPIPERYWLDERRPYFTRAFVTDLARIPQLDRKKVRADALERHSIERMTKDYERVYTGVV